MNILLISTSSEGSLTSTVPDKYKDLSLGHYPPLGLMYLAAYLEKNSAHKARIIDTELEGLGARALAARILDEKPGAIGFYTTSFNVHIVFETVSQLRRAGVTTPIILGGPHVDLYPQETAALPGITCVVIGEGEITLCELLDSMENNSGPLAVKGICCLADGKTVMTPERPLLETLDELPFPARQLTKYDRYYSIIGREKVSTTLMTSRGCPFRCNFCFVQYGGRYRMRSAESVIAEIEECLKLGISEFFFFDEIFTADKRRVMAFCDAVIQRRLGIIFDIRSRIDTIDEELLGKLKQAGCARIQYGIESGCDEILLAMNKKITVSQARKTVELTKKAGIDVFLDFMIGYPGETLEQIRATVKFAKELDPAYVQFGITTLFPGTKIYADALKSGFLKEDFWRKAAQAPKGPIVPPFASERFDRRQLEQLLRRAYISFYFRPRYLFKRLAALRSLTELRRHVTAGLGLLRGK